MFTAAGSPKEDFKDWSSGQVSAHIVMNRNNDRTVESPRGSRNAGLAFSLSQRGGDFCLPITRVLLIPKIPVDIDR